MVYYGFIDESAELYRSLWKSSQREWDRNQKAITTILSRTDKLKVLMEIEMAKGSSVFNFLLNNDKFNYYTLSFTLMKEDEYKSTIDFLKAVWDRNQELGITNE